MRQCPWEEQTVRAQEHAQRRVGAWHHDLVWKKADLWSWGTAVAAGALLPLLSAWSIPWYGVASSAGVRMERDARGLTPLLAVSTWDIELAGGGGHHRRDTPWGHGAPPGARATLLAAGRQLAWCTVL